LVHSDALLELERERVEPLVHLEHFGDQLTRDGVPDELEETNGLTRFVDLLADDRQVGVTAMPTTLLAVPVLSPLGRIRCSPWSENAGSRPELASKTGSWVEVPLL
jgi:hypothetical protein